MRLAVVMRILGLLLMVYSTTMLTPVIVALIFGDGGERYWQRPVGLPLVRVVGALRALAWPCRPSLVWQVARHGRTLGAYPQD